MNKIFVKQKIMQLKSEKDQKMQDLLITFK